MKVEYIGRTTEIRGKESDVLEVTQIEGYSDQDPRCKRYMTLSVSRPDILPITTSYPRFIATDYLIRSLNVSVEEYWGQHGCLIADMSKKVW